MRLILHESAIRCDTHQTKCRTSMSCTCLPAPACDIEYSKGRPSRVRVRRWKASVSSQPVHEHAFFFCWEIYRAHLGQCSLRSSQFHLGTSAISVPVPWPFRSLATFSSASSHLTPSPSPTSPPPSSVGVYSAYSPLMPSTKYPNQ